MKKSYSVVGDKKQGHRIAVPESTGIKKGDRFEFVPTPEGGTDFLPEGSLVYIPAPRPTSKREKKGVSG
jgi:hypothetical protein